MREGLGGIPLHGSDGAGREGKGGEGRGVEGEGNMYV